MAFTLPPLPYSNDALEPHISTETLLFHHGKHHATYVSNLNKLVAADPALQQQSLRELITSSTGPVFTNAAQAWNHSFYWRSMTPGGGGRPGGRLAELMDKTWGSFQAFKEKFSEAAITELGSGWAWLVQEADGGLAIMQTTDAGCPLTDGKTPLLTCDVWEHAYYIDYRNRRADYVAAWWNLVNWNFADSNLR